MNPVLTIGDKVTILGGTKWSCGQQGEVIEVQPSAAFPYKVRFPKDREVYFARSELALVK